MKASAAKEISTTTSNSDIFQGRKDRFNGITVDSTKETCHINNFEIKLKASLKIWQENKIRGVWFRVAIQQSEWIPLLTQHDFWFHHARKDMVMLCRWLSEESCNIPAYCHTMLSVGGLVLDSQGRMLAVKEKYAWSMPMWKLPGGYMEIREDIADAAVREVFEETGVRTKFNSLIGFMHSHTSQFGGSDIYYIAHMTPDNENQEIKKCEREIADCSWIKTEDYLEHPEVHELNKLLVRKFMEIKDKVSLPFEHVPHPILDGKKVAIFSLKNESPTSHL